MGPKIETTECKHDDGDVVADILEGDAKGVRVLWCRLCGGYRIAYGDFCSTEPERFSEWRTPEGKAFPDGAARIAAERTRQLEEWSVEHDARHTTGDLALAAVCYATPVRLHRRREFANVMSFEDPFPWNRGDSRMRKGERRANPGNVVPDPATYSKAERLELLVKAGALIAAEIDRINRRKK